MYFAFRLYWLVLDIALLCIALRCFDLHRIALPCILIPLLSRGTLRCRALHFIAFASVFHGNALHCTATAMHCVPLTGLYGLALVASKSDGFALVGATSLLGPCSCPFFNKKQLHLV